MTEKYIIDTDIGDDIDDAFAIEYAVNAGMDIIGITTVFRDTYLRAELSAYILELLGRRDIPVCKGEDAPLQQPVDAIQKAERFLRSQEFTEQKTAKGGWLPQYLPKARGSKVGSECALDFIIRSAKLFGERLNILAIGPLTNLAKAFEKDFEAMRKVGAVYLMGGNVTEDVAEWNIRLDPEAADIVLHAPVPIFMIGSDMTWKHCMLEKEELRRIGQEKGELGEANRAMLEKWNAQPLYHGRIPCMHDSLVVAAALHPKCISYEKMSVRVGLSGAERGKTLVGDGREIYVARQVNEALFRRSMWENIFGNRRKMI